MTELSGFTPVVKLNPPPGPQSLPVPTSKEDAFTHASAILGALWSAVEAGLSTNVKIEILNHAGTTFCRVTPLQPDGVTETVANPGDYLVVDGVLKAVTPADYAALYAPAQ